MVTFLSICGDNDPAPGNCGVRVSRDLSIGRGKKKMSELRGLRAERQPTEIHGIDSRIPPRGKLGDESGVGDLDRAQAQSLAIALIDIESGQPKMDDGRFGKRFGEVDRQVEEAAIFSAIFVWFREGPTLREDSDMQCSGETFPRYHGMIHRKRLFPHRANPDEAIARKAASADQYKIRTANLRQYPRPLAPTGKAGSRSAAPFPMG
jgi:hypothetical protein